MPSNFAITSPAPGGALPGDVVTFEWELSVPTRLIQWYIRVGSSVGGNQYYQFRILDPAARSHVATGLPLGGVIVHVSLWYKLPSGEWSEPNAYTYTAYDEEGDPPGYEPEDVDFYEAWLLDSSRNSSRVLLIELEHSAGTVRLSSQPWIDDQTSQAYDDWLIDEPEIEDRLEDFSGIGEVDAINALDEEDWLSYNWRGYPCRWYLGDVSWPRIQFRQVASTLIEGIRLLEGRQFRFDLMDAGQHLRQTFSDISETKIISAKSTINHMMTSAGLPAVQYENVDLFLRDYRVEADITPDTLISDLLQEIVRSIGAYVRVSQSRDVEVFIPDTDDPPTTILTEDDIAQGSVNLLSVTPTYKTVRLKHADGTFTDATNAIATGEFDEILEIPTLLYRTEDITPMLAIYAAYYSVKHFVWEFGVFDYASLLQVGDYIGVDIAELTGDGIISRMRRSPLSAYTIIELTI